ncbi:MAG: methyltransferase domain-containing protein [Gammaproteobacteria bacterium]|nr:methyltransferase domain-containing protein [Gammaproteobacteria bacterium]
MAVIPFYGTDRSGLFAIERAAMDRQGLVINALDRLLPDGVVADIGAGDGFTAERLTTPRRWVVALEPAAAMIRPDRILPWVQADAEHLPFGPAILDGAYATWAYFFSRGWDPAPGLEELRRAIRSQGTIAIVDNLGGDEFTALSDRDITADVDFWTARGFEFEIIETAFVFESLHDAQALLGFYFGDRGRDGARLRVGFRAGIFVAHPT